MKVVFVNKEHHTPSGGVPGLTSYKAWLTFAVKHFKQRTRKAAKVSKW